jgi:hypothetical protein
MNTLNALPLSLTLCFAIASALAVENPKDAWLRMIRGTYDSSCAVELLKVGNQISGNNGLHEEQWFVRTCHGDVEYWVSFYPPAAFPHRHSPYEIMRVVPKTK